jgi:hypothetical protein
VGPAVTTAIIAGAVSVVGWFTNSLLSSRADRIHARLAAQLSYVERQLAELYGPLAFLLYEGNASFADLLNTLGRSYVFKGGAPLPKPELQLWLFWVDHDLMPRNAAMQSLLENRSHLIEGSALPDSYVAFLDHYNSWRVRHERWKLEGIEYSWHSNINWPMQFEVDVIKTFHRLKLKHTALVGAVGKASSRSIRAALG